MSFAPKHKILLNAKSVFIAVAFLPTFLTSFSCRNIFYDYISPQLLVAMSFSQDIFAAGLLSPTVKRKISINKVYFYALKKTCPTVFDIFNDFYTSFL